MSGIRVIIIEDDPMVVEINRNFINSVPGFTVADIAKTAREGIEKTLSLKPDLALIDVYLPDRDGLTLLQELRKLQVPTDAILVTAAQDAETIEGAFRYGAVDYILKPFKFQRLKMALESYASMRSRLNTLNRLSQEEIDRLKTAPSQAADEETGMGEIPKGINELTMKQVLLYMIKSGAPMSAEDVAEGIGLARVTARRYLEYLDEIGKASVDLQYGSVGRPIKKYKLI
ncbi:MAG: response regulator [Peptococcaceae bacterium]|nr:response regulator [Peptococcaceae bacterium]